MNHFKTKYFYPGINFKCFKLISLISLLFSCETEIPLDIQEHSKILVVEGWIEQDKTAKILLTYSAGYFESIDSNSLRNYAATRAKVTLFNDDTSEILTLKPNEAYFPPLYYFSSRIKGKFNSKYSIKIEDAGKVYDATTTIPNLIKPDSVWFENYEGNDTLGLLWIEIADDINSENYYRTMVKRLGKDKSFVPTLTSVYNDRLFNGKTIRLSLSRGNNTILEIGESRFFETEDTLILKFCLMDKPHYDFWNSVQNSIITSSNPFSANKTEIKSNIENGLGIWGGYAAFYDTIITK